MSDIYNDYHDLRVDRDELFDKIDADKKRLDWLQDECHTIEVFDFGMTVVRASDGFKFNSDTLREAIDLALKQNERRGL